jgi:thermostable 8-oxoguanine DNA glycosylase
MKKIYDLNSLGNEIANAENEYHYQPELTHKLDHQTSDFSEITLLEIVLWKTNRYPQITQSIINSINDLRKEYSDEKARNLLSELLELKGFDLPMASTVLRFAVPEKLPIIDQRVYRFITPTEDSLKIPHQIDRKVAVYFDYVDRLREICRKFEIEFQKADRVLYQLDKFHNKHIPLKTSK